MNIKNHKMHTSKEKQQNGHSYTFLTNEAVRESLRGFTRTPIFSLLIQRINVMKRFMLSSYRHTLVKEKTTITTTTTRLTEHRCGGFTLVETLVAITILLLVIIGPMTIAQKGIQNAYFATEQATAVFLAQEAIEAVREHRDNKALEVFRDDTEDTSPWVPSCQSGGCAYIGDGNFGLCSSNNNCILGVDSNGKYSHSAILDSPFTRKVFISGTADAVDIKVVVSWKSYIFNDEDRNVTLQTWVYDHYGRYEN